MFTMLGVAVVVIVAIISVGFPLLAVGRNVGFPISADEFASAIGRYVAILAYFVLSLQYVWTARFKVFERLISYDRRVAIHRTLGFLGILLLSLHPIIVLGSYALQDTPFTLTLPVGLGFLSYLILLVVAASTFLGRIWGTRYETWKHLHWLTFVVLILAFVHSMMIGSDLYGQFRIAWIVIFALHVALMLGKFIRKARVWIPTYPILNVRRENQNVSTLEMERPNQTYEAGQFGFLSVKIDGRWQSWHPFSLTSTPDADRATMSIKRVGDFSCRIDSVEPGSETKLDLGFGGFSPRFVPDTRYIMIAGGVGITPIYGVLGDLRNWANPPAVTLLYSCHSESDILYRENLEKWFADRADWDLTFIMTSQPDWPGVQGRLTPNLLAELCGNDYAGTFMLCGPLGMIRSLRRFLISEGVPRRRIRRELFVFLP